jgi:hypothetical protein
MISWPESLVNDLARRKAVLVLGAGISRNSKGAANKVPPDWKAFLNAALKKCERPTRHIKVLLNSDDYLTACEILKSRLSNGAENKWSRLLREEFIAPRYQPSDLHKSIFALDLRLIVSLNFDKIYDTYAQNQSNNTVVVKQYFDDDVAMALRGDGYSIIKMHGSIDSPERMIFTRSEYSLARHTHPEFYSILDALALTHTFLFLGCSLNDPDVKLFLENYTFEYLHRPPHYIVLPGSINSEVKVSTEKNLGVKTITYSDKNTHAELTDSLAELVINVDARREAIYSNHEW